MLRYLKGYRKETVTAPLFKMLEAFFDLLVPLVMADIVNVGIERGDTGYILTRCGVLALLGIIGLACSISAQYFAAKAAIGYAASLRRALFGHIQRLSFSELDAIGTSTLLTRMTSDVNQVQNGLNLFLRLFLRSPFVVIGSMVMAFTIDGREAVIFVVTIPLLAVIVFGIMLAAMPLYRKAQGKLDKILGLTRENLTGTRVVRAFGREKSETERFCRANSALTKLQLKVGRISALMNPLTYALVNVAIVALLNTGAVRINTGDMQQGDMIALVNYMGQILIELVKLANLIIQVTRAAACAGRIRKVLDIKPGMTFLQKNAGADQKCETAVRFDGVSLRYAGAGEESLSDISFVVKKGETVGVIGGTGSGKTSLVNLIPRFYDAASGTVEVCGRSVQCYGREELREKVATVPQRAQLFRGTIRSNLLWGDKDADDNALWRALEIAQAAEIVRKKEKGLDEPVEQGGRNFSGGQKQRLTIARALVQRPKILILDDSMSALDFATDAALRKALRELPNDMTVFIVSQRASSMMHADQILVLDDGRLVGSGSHAELLCGCSVYREIYESQFGKGVER